MRFLLRISCGLAIVLGGLGYFVVIEGVGRAVAPLTPHAGVLVPVTGETSVRVPLPQTSTPRNRSTADVRTLRRPAVAAAWVADVAARTTIPSRALAAYATAQLTVMAETPSCRVSWTTLAGIGLIESGHGTAHGARLDRSGFAVPRIIGPALDGTNSNRAIADTDRGRFDGDIRWDHAVGPMQFIPSTWARWGHGDPDNIDDAALATARYLCASGGDLSTASGWVAAIQAYNTPGDYRAAVFAAANRYAALSVA